MGYLRHLEACNRFDPDLFLPLMLGGNRVGFIRRDNARALADETPALTVGPTHVVFAETLTRPNDITEALDGVIDRLIRRGALGGKRRERFAIMARWGGPLLFELDRGAVPFFGTRSHGVHLNGWRRGDNGVELWVGWRALNKKVAPGKLDNLVAGGVSTGYGARETLVKEAAEEADMPPDLIAQAVATGALRYRMEQPDGLRDDVLFTYDIELPRDFTPRNTDGEFSGFSVMKLTDCLRLVEAGDSFKFNVNLVLIDFAIRRGLITPEHPDYLDLVLGLRGALIREPQS